MNPTDADRVHIAVLLDRSGSMASITDLCARRHVMEAYERTDPWGGVVPDPRLVTDSP